MLENSKKTNGKTEINSKSYDANLLFNQEEKTNTEEENYSPLQLATYIGDYNLVKKLIEKGEDINAKGKNNYTLLHLALAFQRDSIVELLFKNNIKLNEKNIRGYSPLHTAISKNNKNSLPVLIEKLANEIPEALEEKTNRGWTPIYLASSCGNLDAIRLLMEKNVNLLSPALDGSICIHAAAKKLNIKVLQYLFDKLEKNTLNLIDSNGKTAFFYLEEIFIKSNDFVKIMIYNLIKKNGLTSFFNNKLSNYLKKLYKNKIKDQNLTINDFKNYLKDQINECTAKSNKNRELKSVLEIPHKEIRVENDKSNN